MSKPKKLTLAALQQLEAQAMVFVRQIEQASSAEALEESRELVGYYLEVMVEAGYHPVAAEGFAARARQLTAEVQVRLTASQAPEKPAGMNAAGLDVRFYVDRLKKLASLLHHYTPAELARELSRLARRADPRILNEAEFR